MTRFESQRWRKRLEAVRLGLSAGIVAFLSMLVIAGCASRPPATTDNICGIFEDKPRWYKAARKSAERWGTPIHVQMAIIRQESNFDADAKPPRGKALGFIPWKRKSSAYGYAQAKDGTWDWYRKKTGNRWADRDNFKDAIDFVGWYTDESRRRLGISKWDPYSQYLAYHEGHGGFERQTYSSKGWLLGVARKVDYTAKEWGAQLRRCEDDLDSGFWIF